MQDNLDLLLCSVISPIFYGIYSQGQLQESFKSEKKTLDVLLELCVFIKENNIQRIFYANGPGSFTAIKLTHLFLQTLQTTQGLELFCTHTFVFNANSPIRAFGNQYFFKEGEEIVLKRLESEPQSFFALPQVLDYSLFHRDCQPLYVLPAV